MNCTLGNTIQSLGYLLFAYVLVFSAVSAAAGYAALSSPGGFLLFRSGAVEATSN